MNELILKKIEMTSLELSEITGKRHDNVMRDIRNEIEALGEEAALIFEESTYKDVNNQNRPCYIFGRDGAMQLALKYDAITRRKLIIKLEEIQNRLMPSFQEMSPQLQFMINMEAEQIRQAKEMTAIKEQTKKAIDTANAIKEVIIEELDNWRDDIKRKISAIQKGMNDTYQNTYNRLYGDLEARAACDLSARVRNGRKRLEESGASKTKIEAFGRMDVIEADQKLREIFTAIVKEYAVKYTT